MVLGMNCLNRQDSAFPGWNPGYMGERHPALLIITFSLAVRFGSEVVSESVAFWREMRKEVDTSVSHARLMTSEFKDGMLSFEACVSFIIII